MSYGYVPGKCMCGLRFIADGTEVRCEGCGRTDTYREHLLRLEVLPYYASSEERVEAMFLPGWRRIMRSLEAEQLLAYRGQQGPLSAT